MRNAMSENCTKRRYVSIISCEQCGSHSNELFWFIWNIG